MIYLETYSGDDYPLSLVFQDTNGAAIDITGYYLYLTIKRDPNDDDEEAEVTKDIIPIQLSNPTAGRTYVNISDVDTADLDGVYSIDMKYKDTVGNIGTVFNGQNNFIKAITERAV
jgi:hypothetical protein